MLTFVIGCYIPHQDSNFYVCLDKDQPFATIEDDITYFNSKEEDIVFGDMNVPTRSFQLDAQQSFIQTTCIIESIVWIKKGHGQYVKVTPENVQWYQKCLLQWCKHGELLFRGG